MTNQELVGFILLLLLSVGISIAGIGGGSLFIPILLLLFNVFQREASAISNTIIFFSTFVSYVIRFKWRDPLKKQKTLINYSLVMLFNPILLFSNLVGNMINDYIPPVIVTLSLITILLISLFVNVYGIIKNRNKGVEK